jgi:hypothetical protein
VVALFNSAVMVVVRGLMGLLALEGSMGFACECGVIASYSGLKILFSLIM